MEMSFFNWNVETLFLKTIQKWEICRHLKSSESNLRVVNVSIRRWAGEAALPAG